MADHPTKDELSGFVLGTLPPDAKEAVAEHLEQCSPCQETAHHLDAHKDTLQQGLRRTPPPPVDEACRQAVEKVASIASGQKAAPASKPLETTSATIAPGAGITKEQFLKNLQASGLFSADELRDLTDSPVFTAATDAAALARKLVEQSKLTKFQAQHLYQGKTRGFVFGEYVVLDRLGAGGMGQVYKARHRRMDRIVALKVISSASMKSADTVKRFQREVRAAAKLVHPNIVMAHDAGEQDGVHFLVMEYVEGQDLSVALKNAGPLPVRDVVDAVLQAARGLAFAHAEGVVHRDIKPANLLRDKKGTVKILDMGLARFDDPLGRAEDDGLTQSGQVMGTVDYMAPEQAFNTHDATTAADVYSLGCTLYRLLTGQPVFEGKTVVERIIAHRENPAPLLAMVRRDAPAELAALFEEMVAKSQTDRPAMSQVVARLESFLPTLAHNPSAKPAAAKAEEPSLTEVLRVADNEWKVKDSGTDPKSLTLARGKLLAAGAKPSSSPPPATLAGGRKKPPKKLVVAAAAAGALAMVLGIWVVIKNKDGQTVGLHEVPADGSATILESPTPPAIAAANVLPKPGAIANAPPAPFTDRTAAEWIISRKGKVYLLVDGEERTVGEQTAIPTGPFKLVGFGLSAYFDIPLSLEELRRLAPLKLAKLYLARAKLSDAHLAIIVENPELREIDLFDNNGITDSGVPLLAKCSKLERVGLHRTRVTDASIPVLAKIKTLVNLNLGDLPVTDAALAPLSQLSNLEKLGVLGCSKLTGEFALHLRDNKKLKEIDLGNTQLTRKGLEAVASLPPLQILALYNARNPMPAEWLSVFANHPSLTELNLDGNIVGDAAVTYLQSIPKLAKLRVENTGLTTAGITELRRAKPDLQIFGKPAPSATTVAVSRPDDYALEFDGQDDHVELPALMPTQGPSTIEAWIHADAWRASGSNRIETVGCIANDEYFLSLYVQGAAVAAIVATPQRDNYQSTRIAQAPKEPWVHVAAVWDGTNVLAFYNGAAGPVRNPWRNGMDPKEVLSTIGGSRRRKADGPFIPSNLFRGRIASMRYSRTARYQAAFDPPRELVADKETLALYRFDEGAGDVLTDSSGNNHHGKIVGAKWVRADGSAIGPVSSSPLAVAAATSRPRLRMDGDDRVEVPTLKLPHQGPLTLEGYFTPDLKGATNTVHGLGSSYHGVYGHEGWKFMWSDEGRHILVGKLGTPMEDRRTHVAGVLDNGELRLFVDGKLTDRQSDARNFSVGEVFPFEIGGRSWHGVIEEVRVSSVARYDEDFVPAERFEPDAQTLALYHFDEGAGDVLKDSSGNGHHGKIVGAKWERAEGSPIPPPDPALNITTWSPVKWTEDSFSEWRKTATPTESVTLENGVLHLKSRNNHVLSLPNVQGRNLAIKSRVKVITGKPALSARRNSKHIATYYHGASYPDNLKGFGIGTGTIPTAAWKDLAAYHPQTVYTDWFEWILVCRDDELQVLVNGQTIFRFQDTSNQAAGGLAIGLDGEALFENVEYALLDDVKGSVTTPIASGRNSTTAPPLAVAPFDAAQAKAHQEAWAKHLGVPVEFTNSLGMKFALVPPGEFALDASRRVTLSKPIYLGCYEVTRGEFRTFAERAKYATESELQGGRGYSKTDRALEGNLKYNWKSPGFEQDDRHPVVMISWNDVKKFCDWLGGEEGATYRLPTDAEWQFAAAAGTTTRHYAGDGVSDWLGIANLGDVSYAEAIPAHAANSATVSDGAAFTAPVGSYRPNAFGLYDVIGNLYEWCADHSPGVLSIAASVVDPKGPDSGVHRVMRGGSFSSPGRSVGTSWRHGGGAATTNCDIGFRLVREVSGAPMTGVKTTTISLPAATPPQATPAQPPPPVVTMPVVHPPPAVVPAPSKPVTTPIPQSAAALPVIDPNDPTAKKLATAKGAYDREMQQIKKTVLDALERREALARRQADKAAVDAVKAEREAYEKSSTLPAAQWSTLDPKLDGAKKTLLAAYETAIREYTRSGKDAAADTVQQEMAAFQKAVGVIAKIASGAAKKLSAKELLQLHREVAAWAVGLKARVVLLAPTGETAEVQNGQIPTVPFAVKEIHFPSGSQSVVDADMDKLAPLTTLTHLHLSTTNVTDDGIAKLAGLVNLEYLNTHSRPLTDRSMSVIGGLKKLEYLDIAWAKITEAGLDAVADLHELKTINLFAATVTDDGLRKLARLKNLKSLELKNPKISPATIQYLETALPGLRVSR